MVKVRRMSGLSIVFETGRDKQRAMPPGQGHPALVGGSEIVNLSSPSWYMRTGYSAMSQWAAIADRSCAASPLLSRKGIDAATNSSGRTR